MWYVCVCEWEEEKEEVAGDEDEELNVHHTASVGDVEVWSLHRFVYYQPCAYSLSWFVDLNSYTHDNEYPFFPQLIQHPTI